MKKSAYLKSLEKRFRQVESKLSSEKDNAIKSELKDELSYVHQLITIEERRIENVL